MSPATPIPRQREQGRNISGTPSLGQLFLTSHDPPNNTVELEERHNTETLVLNLVDQAKDRPKPTASNPIYGVVDGVMRGATQPYSKYISP